MEGLSVFPDINLKGNSVCLCLLIHLFIYLSVYIFSALSSYAYIVYDYSWRSAVAQICSVIESCLHLILFLLNQRPGQAHHIGSMVRMDVKSQPLFFLCTFCGLH